MLSSEFCVWRPSKKITISVDDARHFRSHTTLKLGVAGVSKVSLWFQVGGCFLAESGIIKDNRYVQYIIYIYIYIYIYTGMYLYVCTCIIV